jgi:hypothetical protein
MHGILAQVRLVGLPGGLRKASFSGPKARQGGQRRARANSKELQASANDVFAAAAAP